MTKPILNFLQENAATIHFLEIDSASIKNLVILQNWPNLLEFLFNVNFYLSITVWHDNIQMVHITGFHLNNLIADNTIDTFHTIIPILLNKTKFPHLNIIHLVDFNPISFQNINWSMSSFLFWCSIVFDCLTANIHLLDINLSLITIDVHKFNYK